jgi:hypothetical protein
MCIKKVKHASPKILDELIKVAQKEVIEEDYPEELDKCACDTCDMVNQCPYAYDPYNNGGDCLGVK